jgi:hypothetical protein
MRAAILPLRKESLKKSEADTKPTPVPKARGRSKVLPVAAAIVIVAAAIFSWYIFTPSGEKSPSPTARDAGTVPSDSAVVQPDGDPSNNQQIATPEGTIELAIRPSGDLYIDGELVGINIQDTSFSTGAGTHNIQVRNEKAVNRVINDEINLSDRDIVQRQYTFEIKEVRTETQAEPVKRTGKVLIGSRPRGANIYINGKLQQQQTPYTFTLDIGKYVIRLELEKGGDILRHSDTIIVVEDGSHRVFFNTEQ